VTLISPAELAAGLASGLLSFPVTHFDDRLEFDEPRYREHLSWQASFGVAGLFAAGGTGEGFSLTSAEIDAVVRAAVSEVGDTLPVVAPATGGTAQATAQATAAQRAGAAGLLLFPPYLTEATQAGLVAHVSALYNFLPDFALRFFAAVRAHDRTTVYQLLNDFVIPYLDIRDRARGYAVSIIKAGLTAVGRDGGRVRPPLTDLAETDRADLAALVDKIR